MIYSPDLGQPTTPTTVDGGGTGMPAWITDEARDSAAKCYKLRPISFLVPQPDYLSARLRLADLHDRDADHRMQVRTFVPHLLTFHTASDESRTGRRARKRARTRLQRLVLHDSNAQPKVENAWSVVAEHSRLRREVGTRAGLLVPYLLDGNPPRFVWLHLAAAFTVFALGGPGPAASYGYLVVVLACIAACVLVYTGWSHGYNQAIWHCAEARVYASKDDAVARRKRLDRRMAMTLPPQPVGEGFLYVVEFSTGVVKVGQTEDPRRRLPTHRAEAAAFGVAVVNYWISPPHLDFRANETRLINRCVAVSKRTRKEYFHDVTYRQAVDFARGLTYHSALPGTSVEGGWA